MQVHPRGRSAETKQATKTAIREAYLNGPKREVQIIPAIHELNLETEKKKLRVCAYNVRSLNGGETEGETKEG